MGIKQDATPCGGMGRDAPHGSHGRKRKGRVNSKEQSKTGKLYTGYLPTIRTGL